MPLLITEAEHKESRHMTQAETKWTKGPWSFDDEGDRFCVYGANSLLLAEVAGHDFHTDIANTHLICMAPELYEALEWAMNAGGLTYSRRIEGQNEHYCNAVDRAHAALRKARGES